VSVELLRLAEIVPNELAPKSEGRKPAAQWLAVGACGRCRAWPSPRKHDPSGCNRIPRSRTSRPRAMRTPHTAGLERRSRAPTLRQGPAPSWTAMRDRRRAWSRPLKTDEPAGPGAVRHLRPAGRNRRREVKVESAESNSTRRRASTSVDQHAAPLARYRAPARRDAPEELGRDVKRAAASERQRGRGATRTVR